MTPEAKEMYVKASFRIERLKGQRGVDHSEEIAKLELVLADCMAGRVAVAATPKMALVEKEPPPPEMKLTAVALEMIEKLTAEKWEIDRKKNKLADSLYFIDPKINCKNIVKEIKSLREEWMTKGDEIRHIEKYGEPVKLDETSGSFVTTLPTDRLELYRKIQNRRTNLSQYRGRLAAAKTLPEQMRQQRNIAKAEIEISLMQTALNAME